MIFGITNKKLLDNMFGNTHKLYEKAVHIFRKTENLKSNQM
jgi:hypothetical protein